MGRHVHAAWREASNHGSKGGEETGTTHPTALDGWNDEASQALEQGLHATQQRLCLRCGAVKDVVLCGSRVVEAFGQGKLNQSIKKTLSGAHDGPRSQDGATWRMLTSPKLARHGRLTDQPGVWRPRNNPPCHTQDTRGTSTSPSVTGHSTPPHLATTLIPTVLNIIQNHSSVRRDGSGNTHLMTGTKRAPARMASLMNPFRLLMTSWYCPGMAFRL